jgi:FtsZ-binding cell division protein ZapB
LEKGVDTVIGVIMDITELKAREADLQVQVRERQRLLANEAAAKEASRLKSQFLANVRSTSIDMDDSKDIMTNYP